MKNTEAKLFSDRLKIAIERAGWQREDALELHAHFNCAAAKPGAIRIATAGNWLAGSSLPTRARLTVLAKCLNVSADWLGFGIDNVVEELSRRSMRHQRAVDFVVSIENLKKDDLVAVSAMVSALLRLQKNSYFGLAAGRPSAGPKAASPTDRRDATSLCLVSFGR